MVFLFFFQRFCAFLGGFYDQIKTVLWSLKPALRAFLGTTRASAGTTRQVATPAAARVALATPKPRDRTWKTCANQIVRTLARIELGVTDGGHSRLQLRFQGPAHWVGGVLVFLHGWPVIGQLRNFCSLFTSLFP